MRKLKRWRVRFTLNFATYAVEFDGYTRKEAAENFKKVHAYNRIESITLIKKQ